jgi:hypothetical protein
MCTDFTDLNKCCPNDDFPLTRIDTIVDFVAGCEIMALLDYFSGYHQIWLCKEDEEKISFITLLDTYCYLRMPEGLCNVGPTFYRMMKAALKDQVGRNVLSYIDLCVFFLFLRLCFVITFMSRLVSLAQSSLGPAYYHC